MAGKQKRQLFPEKLWDLANKPSSGIQWSPDGRRIEVERTQLEKLIGTKFRSHNFDSFIRQLHFYGFKKCGNFYYHDKFRRGQPETLLTMKRKYSNLSLGSLCHPSSTSPSHSNSNTSSNDSITPNSSSVKQSGSASSSVIDGVIDLSNVTANALYTTRASGNNLDYECAIDYSSTRSDKILVKSLSSNSSKSFVRHRGLKDNSKEIVMYTLKPIESELTQSAGLTNLPTFANIREDLARANKDNNSIKITIPEIVKDRGKNAWPKTLVLDNFWNGSQNILSAHFIYTRTND